MKRTEVHFRCELVAFIVPESPAAMLQESSQDATSCMSIPHAPGLLLWVLTMYMSVSRFVTKEPSSLSKMVNRHGHY